MNEPTHLMKSVVGARMTSSQATAFDKKHALQQEDVSKRLNF